MNGKRREYNDKTSFNDIRSIEIIRHLDLAKQGKKNESIQAPELSQNMFFGKPTVEFNFAQIQDTHGGFLLDENAENEAKAEKSRIEAIKRRMREEEPPLSLDSSQNIECYECESPEIDFRFFKTFKCRVCSRCKEKYPEKYSLLTKTECKEDYLLTDSEMRDSFLMPHLLRPNPHKATYSNMMLYLRYQVEEFAFRKWKSEQALDQEFENRQELKKQRKKAVFEKRLSTLRKKTRTAEWSKRRNFEKHVHNYIESSSQDGVRLRVCACGLRLEELMI